MNAVAPTRAVGGEMDQVKSLRKTLMKNGYKPVAVFSFDHPQERGCNSPGKQPLERDWVAKARTGQMPVLTPRAPNSGVLCDGLQLVDLDVDDENAVQQLQALASKVLGDGAPIRIRSNSPRIQLFYRAESGEPKKQKITGTKGGVEVLAHGQQSLVDGVHPSGAPFKWLNGNDLTKVPFDQLPAVSESAVSSFLRQARSIIGAADNKSQNATPKPITRLFDQPRESLGELRELLSFIPPDCDYDTWIRVLMAAHDKFGGASTALAECDAWSAGGSKYKQGEVAAKWKSFNSGGVNGASLAAIARNYGADLSSIARKHKTPQQASEAVYNLSHTDRPEPAPDASRGDTKPRQRGQIIDLSENHAYVHELEIVRDTIPAKGVGFLAGQSGSYKTFCALDLSMSLMTGEPFGGRRIERTGGVIYVASEGAATVSGRLTARRSLLDTPDQKLPFKLIKDFGELRSQDDYQAMAKLLQSAQSQIKHEFDVSVSAVIIDTVSAAGMIEAGAENDPGAWSALFVGCNYLSRVINAPVILVHHYGKSVDAGLRGSSNARAGADFALALTCDRDEITGDTRNHRLALTKSRSAIEGQIASVTASPVEIGKRPCGEPVTSLVLNFDAPQQKQKRARSSKRVVTFKNAFYSAFEAAAKEVHAMGKPDAPKVKAVPREAVFDEFCTRYLAENDNPVKQRDLWRKQFKAALEDVEKSGEFCSGNFHSGVWIWALTEKESQS